MMNSTQIKLFSNMRKLISNGKRRFECRPDRDYVEDLLEIGITEEEAWNRILELNGRAQNRGYYTYTEFLNPTALLEVKQTYIHQNLKETMK